MPRGTRDKSTTGIYHVVLRGINKQRIFEDTQDYQKFWKQSRPLKKLSDSKSRQKQTGTVLFC